MKKFLFAILLFISGAIIAQPANDDICSATSLSVNSGCSGGTVVAATASAQAIPTCWGSKSTDVWFSFVATSTTMTVSTDYVGDGSGDLTDTQLAVYGSSTNACGGTLTQVGCDDDAGTTVPLNSEVNMTTLVVGNTYFVRVDGFGTAVGDFCIGAFDTPPVNELTGSTCATATIVYPNSLACSPANGNSSWNYTGYWTNLVGVNYCGADNETSQHGGWTSFTANSTSTTISNQTAGANAEPLDFTVFTGGCASLTCVNGYSVAKGGSQAITTVVGTTYYVLTTLQSGSTANFRPDICLTSAVGCTAPSNDNCSGAISITASTTYTVSDYCATPDDALCSGSTENNIWYSWTVPATWTGNTYFQLYNQNCQQGVNSPGAQVSIYNANQVCATTTSCIVYSNQANDEDITIGWTPTPGATYLITFDGNGGEVCTMNFAITNVVVLPIELLAFDAVKLNNSVSLFWSTASETNNNFFSIERTNDAVNYETIATVKGAGNSTQLKEYSALDAKPLAGTSYYRLKQVDYDGKVSYSALKTVEFKELIPLSFDVIPNPAGEENILLNFSGSGNSNVNFTIFDVTGKKISSQSLSLDGEGKNSYLINNNLHLSPGIYIIKAENGSEMMAKKLIIK